MRKDSIKFKWAYILIAFLAIIGSWSLIKKPHSDVKTIYIDLSIPLYQDDDYALNYQVSQAIAQRLQSKMTDDKNYQVEVGDIEMDAISKQDILANKDMVISIQSYQQAENKITSYLPDGDHRYHQQSLAFANILANELAALNYQGSYYYYLEPFKNDLYHERILEAFSLETDLLSLPLFEHCDAPILMVNYYYQDAADDARIEQYVDALKQALLKYLGGE
ncbi:MAG: hypothetical protein MR210_02770 [Erysipelotrichaceae bacterium]|nr:hypothetical protein [Erysipelotrichaceae bacterium]MDY5252874.1 hypothetical protein [Erysipelotrichaceae bacterium]